MQIARKKFSVPLLILLIIYISFSFADLSTSEQSWRDNSSRDLAHRLLLMLTVYLFGFFVFCIRKINLQQPLVSMILIGTWMIFVNIYRNVPLWDLLVQSNMAILWILSYLFFEKVGSSDDLHGDHVKNFSFIMVAFYAIMTIYFFFDMLARGNRIPVLNVVYFGLAILPWIEINATKRQKTIVYIIAIIVVLFSMKRGAIIAFFLMMLASFFIQGLLGKNLKGFAKSVAFVLVLAVAFIVANHLSDGFLASRFSEEQIESGSGRMEQYQIVLSLLKKRDLFPLLIGVGSSESVAVLDTGIHNEWLNYLFCYGIIGLLLYFGLIIGFIKKSIFVFKKIPQYAPACFMMVALYFVLSMVSTGYGGYWGFFLFGFWGYLNAECNKQQKKATSLQSS